MEQFIEGIPEDLELKLLDFDPLKKSNISKDDIRTHLKGYNRMRHQCPRYISDEALIYYSPTPHSRQIRVADHFEIIVTLEIEKYGISDSARITIKPRKLMLPDKVKKAYEMCATKETGVKEFLETRARSVNDSMAYDFERVIAARAEMGLDTAYVEQQKKQHHSSNQQPMHGICTDAGEIIRQIIGTIKNPEWKYTHVQSNDGRSAHDTTVVFHTMSGEWIVVNSKSPAKPYALVPIGKLAEIGKPYA